MKGMKSSFFNSYMKHEDFLTAVSRDTKDYDVEYACFYDIVSKHSELKTILRSKKALIPFNDKKCFFDSRSSYSHGHYKIYN